MTVKDIIKELSQINPNYDVMVKVGNNEEQDIVIKISKVLCLNSNTEPAIGFVQLRTANDLDWLEQGPKTGRCNTCRWNDEDLIYNPQCENCCQNYHDNYESVNGGEKNGRFDK